MGAPFRAPLPALAALLAFACRDAQGLRSCTSVNISAEEGSSKVVLTNISSYSKMSSLCKKDSSSSECGDVLIISKNNINLLDNRFRGHFFIQNNNLVIKNVSKVLTGCYQLATELHGSCEMQFCLGIPGNGLAVRNATEKLTGKYWLITRDKETSVQDFFPAVTGSEDSGSSTNSRINILVLLVSLALFKIIVF